MNASEARIAVERWITRERAHYANKKYADGTDTREALVEAMRQGNFDPWEEFITNYLSRVRVYGLDTRAGRQAMGKLIVTCLHTLETAVMVHGPMPRPGVTSGDSV